MQRTVLEILPVLCPPAHLTSMWTLLLMNLLHHLPAADPSDDKEDGGNRVDNGNQSPGKTCYLP